MTYNLFDKSFIATQLCIKVGRYKYLVGYFKVLVVDEDHIGRFIHRKEIIIHTVEEYTDNFLFVFNPSDDDPLIDILYNIICEEESKCFYYGGINEYLQEEEVKHSI